MSNELYLLVVSVLGISLLLSLALLLYVYIKHRYVNAIFALITLVELTTSYTNVVLYYSGLWWEKQFTVYFLLEISCWLYLMYQYFLIKKQSRILIAITVPLSIFLVYIDNSLILEAQSKFLQLLLGLFMFLDRMKATNPEKTIVKSDMIYLSIGIMVYAFINLNLLIFSNVIFNLNIANFRTTWQVHQVSALIYYLMLSLNIWKSRKV